MTEDLKAKKDGALRSLADGSIVESIGPGGVLVVRTEPSFRRDVCPYFFAAGFVVLTHIAIALTHNFYLPLFIVFAISPIQNYFGAGDNRNLSNES